MATKLLVILSILLTIPCPQIYGAEQHEDQHQEDLGQFAEAAAQLFQSQGAEGIGSLLQGVMGGVGDSDPKSGNNMIQILRGLSNMFGPKARGIDTDVISGVLGMIGNSINSDHTTQGPDALSVLAAVGDVLNQPGNAEAVEQFSGYMPLVLDLISTLYSPEAEERVKKHEDHAAMFPPFVERLHFLAERFMNSELGRIFAKKIGADKILKIFSDESGRLSYDKFVELLENHSFRRHWIHMITLRLGKAIEYYSDPKVYENTISMVQFVIGNYLKNQDYPKSFKVDPNSPAESISILFDFVIQRYLGVQINSKYYVEPVISYGQQLLNIARVEGRARGGTEAISAALADSLNLEVIEPVARVNRAYRFLKKNPKCDRYVFCLVNQRSPNDVLPGLKQLLSKGTSFAASWALSKALDRSMLHHLSVIMYEDQCQKYFKPECSDYHEAEVKVTTEYIHNEL